MDPLVVAGLPAGSLQQLGATISAAVGSPDALLSILRASVSDAGGIDLERVAREASTAVLSAGAADGQAPGASPGPAAGTSPAPRPSSLPPPDAAEGGVACLTRCLWQSYHATAQLAANALRSYVYAARAATY